MNIRMSVYLDLDISNMHMHIQQIDRSTYLYACMYKCTSVHEWVCMHAWPTEWLTVWKHACVQCMYVMHVCNACMQCMNAMHACNACMHVCVCMLCMQTCTHPCMHVCLYVCACVHMYECVSMCERVCMWTHRWIMSVCMHASMYAYPCIYIYTYTLYVYIQLYMYVLLCDTHCQVTSACDWKVNVITTTMIATQSYERVYIDCKVPIASLCTAYRPRNYFEVIDVSHVWVT